MSSRADAFFEEELVLSNIFALFRSGALRQAFEERVLRDTTAQVNLSHAWFLNHG